MNLKIMNQHKLIDRFSLESRVALVTGASSGLGEHFAYVLAEAGARVVVTARRTDRINHLVEQIKAKGWQAVAVPIDVTDAKSVADCFEHAMQAFGVPDIVVNNAGVTVTKAAIDQTVQDWNQVIDTNLKGCWLVATEAARRLISAQKSGSIINIASILGERVAASVGPYAISKAGVIQATKVMALEWARHNIRVNALLPGYIRTELNSEFLDSPLGVKLQQKIPSRQFGNVQDLSGPLLLLASDAGSAMSGSTLEVDRSHLVSSL
jgi:NAD(P)-dependent dehydrogenase (short-subunit alcohol dehydrogenase family)